MRTLSMKLKASKSAKEYEFSVTMPDVLADEDAIILRFGSVDRMIDRAVAQWKVDAATGGRKCLPNVDACQEHLDTFRADGKKSAPVKITISADQVKAQGFSDENVEMLRKLGITI